MKSAHKPSIKPPFQVASRISVLEITKDNLYKYRNYYRTLSNPAHFRGFMKGRDINDINTYKGLFETHMSEAKVLGLFRDNEMIGQFLYFTEGAGSTKIAVVQGLEIADKYKGLGYFKKLTDAMVDHVQRELGSNARVLTTIRTDNPASLRIAKRYGMEIVDDDLNLKTYAHDGYHLLEYKGSP